MKWSEAIAPGQPLRDVRVLMKAPAQDWEEHLREREQAAYENGRRDGEHAVSEQLLRQRNETAELQNGILNSLQQALPQLIQENELALISLALEAAQKIVAGLPIDSQMVEAVVREALRQVEDTAEITIQLHSDDLALMQNSNSPLLNGLPETGPLRFVGSPEITRGGCLVQTRFGIIDARRETKMEQLRKTLIA
ncbi:MAG TPA: FliH/SctL family protein [Verrucomicrobiae bacterium]|nr:FliH/SctL family protein [Verrucomicrobiae bacterium]